MTDRSLRQTQIDIVTLIAQIDIQILERQGEIETKQREIRELGEQRRALQSAVP